MLRALARKARREDGQALVLAAVALLVVALTVGSTLSIGQLAYERIRLQGTADAAAYELALEQARVFNFFAYTNRAMIVHYHAMLTLVSQLSYAIYLDHTFGRLLDSAAFAPWVGPVLEGASALLDRFVDTADVLVEVALPLLGRLNDVYFLFQVALWTDLQARLAGGSAVAARDDPDVRIGPAAGTEGAAAALANVSALHRAVDYEALSRLVPGHPDWNKVVGPAPSGNAGRALMTELVNAARHGWVAGTRQGPPLLGRTWSLGFSALGFGLRWRKTARTELGMLPSAGVGATSRHDQIYAVDALELEVTAPGMRLEAAYRSEVAADHADGFHRERLAVDLERCAPEAASACALADGLFALPLEALVGGAIDAYAAALEGGGRHHRFEGITPFMKFAPDPRWRTAFHQPDVVVVARRNGETSPLRPLARAVDAVRGGASPAASSWGDGVAVAVARTYYHRPGDWQEHPNFFNPFWGARLQPAEDHADLSALGLSGLAGAPGALAH